MTHTRYWLLFAICALAWLVVSLCLAPSMSGEDVYIFRDPGWNLASYGSFQSAALVYMTDLTPRLNSHYTPLLPLLFAGYASVFPRNPYSGTIFNLLVGLAAAAAVLRLILLHPAGRLRNLAAVAVAVLPAAFITMDRPEALALALFCATAALASLPGSRPILVGLLIALTFLAHPFGAIAAAIWASALFLARNWSGARRWSRTLGQVAIAGVSAAIPIALVAWIYYALDPDSLARFAAHSLGRASGMHAARSGGWTAALHKAIFGLSAMGTFNYLAALATVLLVLLWAVAKRRSLTASDWILVLAGVLCTLASILVFSIQANYIFLLSFLIPAGLLLARPAGGAMAAPALALLLLAILIRIPPLGMSLLERAEQLPSYRAARSQPDFLRAQLADPGAVVDVEGDSYDLFKPQFRRMVRLDYVQDVDRYRSVAAVANCYDAYHDAAGPTRPLPSRLDPRDFHLVQPAPLHLWVTVFGKRLMRAQWGYGCDLYVRNSAPAVNLPAQGMQTTQ